MQDDSLDAAPSDRLFSYWSGPISWMERLSLDSARARGYDVTVYSFEPQSLEREGLNCRVADAREVMDDSVLEGFRSVSPSHFTDHFRLEAIRRGCGTWIDLDIVFLRRLPDAPYLFGWANRKSITNAILRFPDGAPLLADYIEVCRQGRLRGIRRPPAWYPWHRRLWRRFKDEIGSRRSTPIYGPRTLTHLVQKHGLAHLAQPCRVLNPIPPDKPLVARMMLGEWPESAITPDTVCVHLWRSLWHRGHLGAEPPWAQHVLADVTRPSAAHPHPERAR
jgi:hypothetical protein